MQSQRTSLLNVSSHVSQNAEEVSFAANGITAAGLKAFDGVLQSNIVLKTLDLSGNPIGDEGAKCLCDILIDNAGIQKLQLNSADLGDEVSNLEPKASLVVMCLKFCPLFYVGAKAIAEMLKKIQACVSLSLTTI
ncbi:hypothetical protein AAG906_011971 [Vitis piasezkii]